MKPSETTSRLTQLTVMFIGVFLTLRFFLRLFNADITNRLVAWIYQMTLPLVKPLSVVFPLARTGDGFVFEFTTLLALVVYSTIGLAILAFVASFGVKANSTAPARRFQLAFSKKKPAKRRGRPRKK